MSTTSILFAGVTGYVGATIFDRLLQHPERSSFDITALVRDADKAKKLESLFGVKVIVGSLTDSKLVEDAASRVDIVFNVAEADNLGITNAILTGLKRRHDKTGKAPILIHTSGTGFLMDSADGLHSTETIWSDLNVEQIESLPDSALHRNVDLEIVAADKLGYVRTYIIAPSTIYGIGKGPLYDAGIANRHSIQIPVLIKAAINRGRAGLVGEGKNVWTNVSVEDVADLYVIIFDLARKSPETLGHGREGYYYVENGEHEHTLIGEAIGAALVKAGKALDASWTTFTDEECLRFFGGKFLGSNARARADRARAIGWKPTRTTTDMVVSIGPEVEALLAKTQ